MGLPIILNSKSVSQRPIATYVHHVDEQNNDNARQLVRPIPVQPGSPQLPSPLVAWAVTESLSIHINSGHQTQQPELQALINLYYFTVSQTNSVIHKNNGSSGSSHDDEFNPKQIAAEFRIQVAPAAAPFSSTYPETIHNVLLPVNAKSARSIRFPHPSARLEAHFSQDRKALICVFPLPRGSNTLDERRTLSIVFPLRRASAPPPIPPPPLPSYLQPSSAASQDDGQQHGMSATIPIAAEPRVINDCTSNTKPPPILNVSCLCNVSFADDKKSFVLVGDSKGNVRAVTMNPLVCSEPIRLLISNNGEGDTGQHGAGIKSMHSTTEGFIDDCYRGQLAVLDTQEFVTIWRWQLTKEPKGSVHDGTDTESPALQEVPLMIGNVGSLWFFSLKVMLWRLPVGRRFRAIRWVTPWNLACLCAPGPGRCTVSVFDWADDGHPIERSTLVIRNEELRETATSTFTIAGTVGRENEQTFVADKMEHDPITGSLLISSSFANESNGAKNPSVVPFVTIWNWRSNVRGFSSQSSDKCSLSRSSPACHVLSHLFLARDHHGYRRIVHVTAIPNAHKCQIQKDIYETGTLSPPSRFFPYRPIVPETPLMITSESICYPSASKLTVLGDHQVEWKEVMIPSDYRSNRNAPQLSCISKRGLSIAVAGSRGFCTLECPPAPSKKRSRWHRFSNDQSERSFRVLAMSWWEGCAQEDYMAEDLLVAVVAVEGQDGQGARFLSCWSPHRLDMNHQVFVQVQVSADNGFDSQWGVRLADDISTASIDILEEPSETTSSSSFRKAMVLLSNDSSTKEFMVFQVQLVRRSQSAALAYSEKQPCAALIRCVGEYELGSPADLFLAGGSFAFDLLAVRRGAQSDDTLDFIAQIGVIRRASSGFDAMAISASTITAIGSLPISDSIHCPAQVSSYWLSDIADKISAFVWTLQLSDGTLMCWSVPFAGTPAQHQLLTQGPGEGSDFVSFMGSHSLVHSKTLLLGSHCTAGSSETWMQVSNSTTKHEISLGPLPGSAFGCILGSGQGSKKMPQHLGEALGKDFFSPDFMGYEVFGPTNFVLFPPAVVTALYMFLRNSSIASFLQVQEHLRWRLESYPFRDSVLIALRLLTLRSVEKYASTSDSKGRNSDRVLLEAVTNLVRNLTSPLRFSAFFLEIGRQLEPSCFKHLFPLPDAHVQTLTDLVNSILDCGCLGISVAALPLLEDRRHASSLCTFILNHCLKKLTRRQTNVQFPEEEARITPDVFRYGLKLADPNDRSLEGVEVDDVVHFPTEESRLHMVQYRYKESKDGKQDEEDLDDEESLDPKHSSASYFCGLSKFFDPAARATEEERVAEAATSFIDRNFEDLQSREELEKDHAVSNGDTDVEQSESFSSSSEGTGPTAAGVVARHLLEPIFTKGKPNWTEVGRLAELVLGNRPAMVKFCSVERFDELLRGTSVIAFESWVTTGASAEEEVDRFLLQNLRSCRDTIGSEGAAAIFDLVLILLAYENICDDMVEEVPGLLLLALVVGDVLGRLDNFPAVHRKDQQVFLVGQYLKAVHRIRG